ncbi:hypothetical protein SLS60_009093 [Paraconiothyrium brasiliense]|uniref:Rhodopsin domain-containing protein n=1 Tax=Paraconiothyrium brasiliense TaxID=300254 RepID=A0ABR3QWB1_9PLEO
MDFILAILPWHIIMGLNMKRKEKLTVACGLSLGVFAGICSIVRTYELQSLSSLNEYVYDTVPMLLWSSTEVFTSIICACIPILRPLYVRIVHGSKYGLGSSGRASHSYPLKEYAENGYPQSRKDAASGMSSRGYASTSAGGKGVGVGVTTKVRMGSDNVSEESILRETKLPIQGYDGEDGAGIRRTDEIVVTSSAV